MISNTLSTQNRVLNQSLLLTGLMLIPTALGAYLGYGYKFGIWGTLGLFLLSLVLLFGVFATRNNGMCLPIAGMFNVVIGLTLSGILSKVIPAGGANIVISAATASIVTFVLAAAYGATTKKNVASMGNALTIALVGVIIVGLINILIGSPLITLLLACASVAIFTLLIVYEVNEIVTGGETNPVLAAIGLYMSLINLFTSFIQIFSAFDD